MSRSFDPQSDVFNIAAIQQFNQCESEVEESLSKILGIDPAHIWRILISKLGRQRADAWRLVYENRFTMTEVARQTGIHRNTLYRDQINAPDIIRSYVVAMAIRDGLYHGSSGSTISWTTAMAVVRDAWTVSLAGYEKHFPRKPCLKDIEKYVWRHRALLNAGNANGHELFVGAYKAKDGYYFDLTVPIHNKNEAIARGIKEKQREIVHLLTHELLAIGAEPERKAA